MDNFSVERGRLSPSSGSLRHARQAATAPTTQRAPVSTAGLGKLQKPHSDGRLAFLQVAKTLARMPTARLQKPKPGAKKPLMSCDAKDDFQDSLPNMHGSATYISKSMPISMQRRHGGLDASCDGRREA
jgi:hypothetical protein